MCATPPPADPKTLVDRIRALCSPLRPEPTGYPEDLRRLDNVRAVLFDVYGTLLVSGSGDISVARPRANAPALEDSLAAAGFAVTGEAGERGVRLFLQKIREAHEQRRQEGVEYPEVEVRDIWRDVLSDLIEAGLARGKPGPARVARLAVEYECRTNPIWPMPSAGETLMALHHRGKTLGIVSNAQFYTTLGIEALLGATPEARGFEQSLCAWSYQLLEAKPSVRLFQSPLARLAERYGIMPGDVLYVGNDMLNDIMPAVQAGCKTALFAGDRRSLRLREDDPRCADIRPDAVVTDLRQLARVVP